MGKGASGAAGKSLGCKQLWRERSLEQRGQALGSMGAKAVGFSREVLSDPQFKKAASCREMGLLMLWSFKPSVETGRSKRLDIQINKRIPSDHHSPREFGFGNS